MKLKEDIQNRNGKVWGKLCDIIDRLAEEEAEEFVLVEEIGRRYYSDIYTLPKTISKLKKVKKMVLYGSNLRIIPPEIGEMSSLETFIPYTSYDLHWFPYEILKCKKLNDSTISTRALYGNYKGTLGFPSLAGNPIKYSNETIKCSVCGKIIDESNFNQLWVSLNIGTDIVPLLVNSCSNECTLSIQKPPKDYIQYPHKGGFNAIERDQNTIFRIAPKKETKIQKYLKRFFKK